MPPRDTRPFDVMDIPAAVGLLTRLPVPVDTDLAQRRGAKAAWAYPLAGLVVGALQAALIIALTPVLSLDLVAGLALVLGVVVTGALHEDGLADAADGLWGGWDAARRLEIMKDSRIGVYGVAALVLSLGLRWHILVGLCTLSPWMVIPLAMVSRAAMVAPMSALPHARGDGLARHVGVAPAMSVWAAAVLSLVPLAPWPALALAALGAGLASAMACTAIARAKIGGQTGDILGATQQVTDIVLGLTLLAVLM